MLQYGRHLFGDILKTTDTSPEVKQAFREESIRREVTFTTYVLALYGGILFLIWPGDFFYFEDQIFRAILTWRVAVIPALLLTLGVVYFLDFSRPKKRFLYTAGFGVGILFTFYHVFSFSETIPRYQLSYMVAISFVLPFIPVIQISRSLLPRIVITASYVLLSHLGMFLGSPPGFLGGSSKIPSSIYATSAVWNFGTCLLAVTAGHLIHLLYRFSFFLSQDLADEKERSENLLVNILPEKVSHQLKNDEDVSEEFDEVTVLFADIVEFTPLARELSAGKVVSTLDTIFSEFDELVNKFGLEKIKTVGDEYFVAAGVPDPLEDHAVRMAEFAVELNRRIENYQRNDGEPFQLRIGMNTGPLVAGIIGKEKFVYDVWGETVNVGSRMESLGSPGKIQVTSAAKNAIESQDDEGRFIFDKRGSIDVKGQGTMTSYFLRKRD